MSGSEQATPTNVAGRAHGGSARKGARVEAARGRGGQLGPFKTVMAEFGIPYQTGRDAAFRGEFPIARLGRSGRSWFVRRADIAAWIDGRMERLS